MLKGIGLQPISAGIEGFGSGGKLSRRVLACLRVSLEFLDVETDTADLLFELFVKSVDLGGRFGEDFTGIFINRKVFEEFPDTFIKLIQR